MAVEDAPDFYGVIDRVYVDAPRRLTLSDCGKRMEINQHGFADTVVWNPGFGRAAVLGDMPQGDENHMLCVEAAQVVHPIELLPGETWIGAQEATLYFV